MRPLPCHYVIVIHWHSRRTWSSPEPRRTSRFPRATKASTQEPPRHTLTCFTDGHLWQPSRTQLHTHFEGAASAQPHAHTTSYPKHLEVQAMLAAPRSPVLAPASCAASPRARFSPPRLTCCRRSALSGSLLAVLQPPPHLTSGQREIGRVHLETLHVFTVKLG